MGTISPENSTSPTAAQPAARMPTGMAKRSHQRRPEKNRSHRARKRKAAIPTIKVPVTRCRKSRFSQGQPQMQAAAAPATHKTNHGNQKRKNVFLGRGFVVAPADMSYLLASVWL